MQHPLFPDAPDDERELAFIRVYRFTPDGKRHVAPESFAPGDMADIEQLFNRFGGGNYELVAHDSHGKVITRARLSFEGRPRPMAGSDEPETGAPTGGNGNGHGHAADPLMLAILQLMQQQGAQQTQLLVALVERGDKTSREHIATMQALHDRHAQSQSELMAAILAAGRSGNGDASHAFQSGVQFATGFAEKLAEARAAGGDDDDDEDDLLGMVNTIAEAAQTMTAAKAPAQQFAQGRTEPAAPPQPPPRSKHPPKSPTPPTREV